MSSQNVVGVGPKMRDHMATLYEQNPNSHLLMPSGPAHLVYVYNMGEKRLDTAKLIDKKEEIRKKYGNKISKTKRDKKKKRLLEKEQQKIDKVEKILKEGNQLMRWGEQLAILDNDKIKLTGDKMSQYLNSRGYYANKINIEEKYKGKDSSRVEIKYAIKKGPEYFIDSIQLIIPDRQVRELYMENLGSAELRKRKVRQLDLTAERDRVYEMMVNNGYFAFSKDLVYFQIDSVTLGSRKLLIREIINNPPNRDSHEIFEIDSVIFVTDAGFDITKQHENEPFRDITYTFGRFKYSTKILDWHTYLYADNLYQRDNVLETQRQLSYLDNFKFINVNFDTLGGKFTAHIFTSPADRYQTSSEIGFSKTQGLPGPFANLTIKNRNLFRGLEIVELNTNFKVVGLESVSDQKATYSSLQYGSELSITFPQFLSPLGRFYKKKIAKFNPRTRFGLAFGHEDRFNEYKRTTVNTNMSYSWKVQDHVSYTLAPMDISYIDSKTDSSFQVFLDVLALSGNTYASAFSSAFVSSGSFQVIVNNNYGVSRNSSYAQFYVETGGHLFSLFVNAPFGNSLEYYKYAKTSVDVRKYFYLNRKTSLVTRLNVGVAIPYGSNNSLPYTKYFFGGGSNSLRAWKPRRLGPGAYGEKNPDGTINYQLEQPGDMTLEMSAEIRQKLFGFVNWAFFVDAGNIWLLRSETVNSLDDSTNPGVDDGVFEFKKFAKEIAIGSGLGLRFDLSFLIFRVDLGWKFVDPAQEIGKRWVGNKIFPDPLENAEINIGIGYPF
ncbi:MAG: BamA/TamA family outer membrane protein [Cytophagales bacterium]|nr:BamA/TamA family outer membrane protein [Cytophagales bacterium]